MLNKKYQLIIAFVVILIGIIFRLVDHLPNFTPLAAIALFSGAYLSRKLALIIPIIALLLSDLFIGFYSPSLMVIVYGSFILTVIMGWWLKDNQKWPNIITASLLAGLVFFLITNFAVWAFGTMYMHNLAGLMQSYAMAIPFFRNSLLGDLFYVGILVGSFEALTYFAKSKTVQTEKIN